MHRIQNVDLKFGWMLILLVVKIRTKLEMQTMSTLAQALLYIMLAVLSIGKVNCKQKSHYQQQRLSILQCHRLWGRQFLWQLWCGKQMRFFRCTYLSPDSSSKCKKTINRVLQWLRIQSLLLGSSTLLSNIIISESMWLLKQTLMGLFHLSIAWHMIRLQTSSLSLFWMITSSSLERVWWGGD